MLKVLSMVFIAAGFAALGRFVASYQQKKVDVLKNIILMVNIIETQLRYACLPVSDLLRFLGENPEFSQFGFIRCAREKMCFGESFSDAWRESIEIETELCGMLPESVRYLTAFGAEIGSTDLEGQLSRCCYYKNIFEKELEIQEEKSRRYTKLFPNLGLVAGVSAAILIV